MKTVLFFDNMLTPKIIVVVYWFMLISAVVSGFGVMIIDHGGVTMGSFFSGSLAIIGGMIGARIVCELMIVLFKINEALQELRTKE